MRCSGLLARTRRRVHGPDETAQLQAWRSRTTTLTRLVDFGVPDESSSCAQPVDGAGFGPTGRSSLAWPAATVRTTAVRERAAIHSARLDRIGMAFDGRLSPMLGPACSALMPSPPDPWLVQPRRPTGTAKPATARKPSTSTEAGDGLEPEPGPTGSAASYPGGLCRSSPPPARTSQSSSTSRGEWSGLEPEPLDPGVPSHRKGYRGPSLSVTAVPWTYTPAPHFASGCCCPEVVRPHCESGCDQPGTRRRRAVAGGGLDGAGPRRIRPLASRAVSPACIFRRPPRVVSALGIGPIRSRGVRPTSWCQTRAIGGRGVGGAFSFL